MADQIEEMLLATIEAINKSGKLDAVIEQIQDTGLCERVDGDDIDNGGLAAFEHSADGNEELWGKVLELVEAYFEGGADGHEEILTAELNLSLYKQDDKAMRDYMSGFKKLVRKLLRAGGSITSQRKIQMCLQGSGVLTREEFKEYIKMAKLGGAYTGAEYTEWHEFSKVMGRIGKLSASSGGDGNEKQEAQGDCPAGMHPVQNDSAAFREALDASRSVAHE